MSVTVREEQRLRAFKNVALWNTFGTHRHDVEGDWRKLHSEESFMICTPHQMLLV
jgi:hypothetical protein